MIPFQSGPLAHLPQLCKCWPQAGPSPPHIIAEAAAAHPVLTICQQQSLHPGVSCAKNSSSQATDRMAVQGTINRLHMGIVCPKGMRSCLCYRCQVVEVLLAQHKSWSCASVSGNFTDVPIVQFHYTIQEIQVLPFRGHVLGRR